MDYGLALGEEEPGKITHAGQLRRFFQRRPNTLLVDRPAVGSLNQFITFLSSDASGFVIRPIENALIGSHSNAEGVLEMKLFVGQTSDDNGKTHSDYESLEAAMAGGPTKTIAIPDALIGPNPTTHFVHFKGCNIGKASAVPFMQKWKEAMGNKARVTAPKYSHGVTDNATYGSWEYLVYEFIIRSPERITNRNTLITAFQLEKFTFLEKLNADGTLSPGDPVPDDVWKSWIPPGKTKNSVPRKSVPQRTPFSLESPVGPRQSVSVNQELTVDRTRYPWKITYDTKPIPPDKATRLADLLKSIVNDDKHTPSRFIGGPNGHKWPIYQRLGYTSAADFVAGYTWEFTPDTEVNKKTGKKTPILICVGRGFRYTMNIAVTTPNPGATPNKSQIIANFIPNRPPSIFANQATTRFRESDIQYFTTV